MKTQKFGFATCLSLSARPHLTNRYAPARRGATKEEFVKTWAGFATWDWGYLQPTADYRKNRENGIDADNPQRPFPNDGIYKWGTPGDDQTRMQYDEGADDKIWMEEKDRNYVMRLEREGKLAATEPNLKTEVPKLYVEVFAARTKNPALVGEYLRATESAERDYRAAKERWEAADKAFRQTCVTYWQTNYDANYESGQKQADAKRVLDQCKAEMQKAKATTQEPEAKMQAALAAKQKTEQAAVAMVEKLTQQPKPDLRAEQKAKEAAAAKERERLQKEKLAQEQAAREAALIAERDAKEEKAAQEKAEVERLRQEIAAEQQQEQEIEAANTRAELEKLKLEKQRLELKKKQIAVKTPPVAAKEEKLDSNHSSGGSSSSSGSGAAALAEKNKISAAEMQQLQAMYQIAYSALTCEQELGKGSFGVVCKGTYNEGEVAIKKLLVDKMTAASETEFKNETAIMARLKHPNIITLFGYTISPYCMVMELMTGGSLFQVLHNEQELPWSTRFVIVRDIIAGLVQLHEAGIVHRDLKSLNVLLSSGMRAKIADFGLSKVKTETKTKSKEESVGTIQWMAPELFSRPKYTPASDIYAYAIVLWEIASRQIPYEGMLQVAIMTKVENGTLREEIPEDCPPKVSSLIKFCWAQEAAKRPTARQIGAYLKSNAEKFDFEPVAAAPAASSAAPSYRGNFDSMRP